MAGGPMTLQVVTPERVTHNLTVNALVVPTIDGYIAIWQNHAPLMTALGVGLMWYRDSAGVRCPENTFAVCSGFLEVLDNKLSIFAETVERGDEVDLERALASKRRAEERLKRRAADIDVERAQLALAKAMARIRATGGHPLGD